MSVISITITEATEQVISGIPRTISLSANIPSTIFFTLDGTDPTVLSSIYTQPIKMPVDLLIVVLKVFATNGVDSSPIISKPYSTSIINDTRLSHAAVSGINNNGAGIFPFGSNAPSPIFQYQNSSLSGFIVNDPTKISDGYAGFDVSGNPIGFYDDKLENYQQTFTTSTFNGQTGKGIGNLPAKTTVIGKMGATDYTSEQTDQNNQALFDPRALVIFQDVDNENPDDPAHLNRMSFSTENPSLIKDGTTLFNSFTDSTMTTTGTFLRSHYNPRTNTIKYYYFDSAMNRWIISESTYEQKNPDAGKLYTMYFPRKPGEKYVYKWIPFQSRRFM